MSSIIHISGTMYLIKKEHQELSGRIDESFVFSEQRGGVQKNVQTSLMDAYSYDAIKYKLQTNEAKMEYAFDQVDGPNIHNDDETIPEPSHQYFRVVNDTTTSLLDSSQIYKKTVLGQNNTLINKTVLNEASSAYSVHFKQQTQNNCQIRRLTTKKRENFMCEICGLGFTLRCQLLSHLKKHNPKFKCDKCGAKFSKVKGLTYHTTRSKCVTKTIKCEQCESWFSDAKLLEIHTRIHRGEKPHKCDICFASFTNKQNLKHHTLIHRGERPHICEVCFASFVRKETLKQHTILHSGAKPYTCEVCNASFNHKQSFNKHSLVHIEVLRNGVLTNGVLTNIL